MKIIYQIRAWICRAFMQLELPIKIVAKFAFAFLIFERISAWDGFQASLPFNSAAVHMILALLCILLPMRFATFFAIIIILYNIYQASFWGAIIAAVMLLVLYILISRLAPDETILMILMPLLMKTNILIVPLFAGAFMGVFSIIPIVGGIVLWSFMRILPVFLKFDAGAIDELPELATETISYIADQFIKNKELMFLMILCAGVVVVVWLLDKVNFNYMRYLAVIAGAAVGFVCLVVGRTTGMVDISVVDTVKMPLIAMLIMIFVEFFHIALNYKMSRRLEFADDEYYYYVKAIPKILALSRKPEIKTITDGRTQMLPTAETARTETAKTDEAVKETIREAVHESAPAAVSVPEMQPEAEETAQDAKQEKQSNPITSFLTSFKLRNAERKDDSAEEDAVKTAEAPTQAKEQPELSDQTTDGQDAAEQNDKEQKPAIDLTNVKVFFAGLGSKAKKGFENAKGFVTEKATEIKKTIDEKKSADKPENLMEDAENAAETAADAVEKTAETAAADNVLPEVGELLPETDDIFQFEADDEIDLLPEAGETTQTVPEAEPAKQAAEQTVEQTTEQEPQERPVEPPLSDLLPDDIRSEDKIENLKKDTGWSDETIRLFFDGLDEEDGKSGK